MADPLQIILGLTTLADTAMSIVDRYSRGELTDEELAMEEARVMNRVAFAETVMEKAKVRRAEREAEE